MKAPITRSVLISFLTVTAAFGQQQEKKLLDRIQRPDMQLGNPLQTKSFEATGIKINASNFADKNFLTSRSGAAKEFSGLRSFLGVKNPWFGKPTFDAKTASLATRKGFDSAKSYNVKSVAASTYTPSASSPKPAAIADSSKPFLVKGKAEGAMQQLAEKVGKEMTIDEVRELLNKPR